MKKKYEKPMVSIDSSCLLEGVFAFGVTSSNTLKEQISGRLTSCHTNGDIINYARALFYDLDDE